MEKKTLLAVAISAALLIIYTQFINPTKKAPPPPSGTQTSATLPIAPTVQSLATASLKPGAPAPVTTKPFETPNIKTEISSRTGFPIHWWLKKYFSEADGKGGNIDLLAVTPPPLPMQLILSPDGRPSEPFYPAPTVGPKGLSYSGQLGPWGITQSVELGAVDSSLEIKINVENQSSDAQTVAPGLRLSADQHKKPGRGFWIFKEAPNQKFPLFRIGNDVERFQQVEKLGPLQEQVGEISWGGLEDQYFLRIILARTISAQNRTAYGVNGSQVFSQLQYPTETIAPGQKKEYAFTVYLGPKDPDLLAKFGAAHLDKAVDYGWFGWVALPILYGLKFFQSFLHNWGLAIIFLTIAIKILLQPLTKKSMQSMKAMQEIQPQLQRIREKYKDDRERLNLETMSLFRANKVNPAGGCLPMLVQMPIYIALYKVLYNATELYHAPFVWFYRDLSAPDPYFILPILLGVFMVLQQKMTPMPGDPSQAKLLMFMPVIFSAFMLFLPLGLVLYIFVNTVMTVVQQWMHTKNISLIGLIRGKKA